MFFRCTFKPRLPSSSGSRYSFPWPFLLSLLVGLVFWKFWPVVTGVDIWDAGAGFFAAIFAAGFLLGWIERRRTWRWAFGIFAGPALLSLPSLRREFAHGLGRDWFGYAFFWAMLLFLASVFLAAFAGSYAGTKAGGRGMK